MPYYDIPSYAEYEGVDEQNQFYEGACTWIACLIPEDKPAPVPQKPENSDDLPF